MVLSGSPEEDAAAYQGASEELSEADWQVLLKIAPKPVWQRIRETHRKLPGSSPASRPAGDSQGAAATRPAPSAKGKTPRREVVAKKLPDGGVQFVWDLEHYGGSIVKSSRDGGTSRQKISVRPPDFKPILALVKQQLADKGTVLPLPEKNRLVVTCEPSVKDSVINLLNEIDVPTRQVEITARIFEVSHDFDFQYGAKMLIKHIASDNKEGLASAFSARDFVGSVVEPIAGDVPDPGAALRLMKVFTDAGLTVDATFQALADTGLIKVVSTPRMTVRSGQTASILAGKELPIQSGKISNQQFVAQRVDYKPVGVQLYITPQVVARDSVKLHVSTTVSAISGFAPLPPLDNDSTSTTVSNPILDSREAETYVSIPDRQTLVIGGLRNIRTVTREQKIPGLGDIEGIEWLFKNHRSQKLVNDLYFFVTPHIIR